jgi:methionine aminopeptidase
MAKRSKIPIKTKQEIVMMREAGKVASDVLQRTAGFIAAGKQPARSMNMPCL